MVMEEVVFPLSGCLALAWFPKSQNKNSRVNVGYNRTFPCQLALSLFDDSDAIISVFSLA